MSRIESVHYVDFTGDLHASICGEAVTAEELDAGKRVTVFMSSATCLECVRLLQRRFAAMAQASSCATSADSSSART